MNKIPLIPLPKQSEDEPLKPIQLVMLWLIWASGILLSLVAFLIEQTRYCGVKGNPHKVVKKRTKLPDNGTQTGDMVLAKRHGRGIIIQ